AHPRRRVFCDHAGRGAGRGNAGADDDPQSEHEHSARADEEDPAGGRRLARRGEADRAPGHRQCTVLPRVSKELTIAGAAPTRKAAIAEMSVPLRPRVAWW